MKMRPIEITPTQQVAIGADASKAIEYACQDFVDRAIKAIDDHKAFFVALSGGSTPKALFQKLSSKEWRDRLDWSSVWLFWSDERCVPPNESESNYRSAMDSGLSTLPITEIFRMKGEEDPKKAAEDYEMMIQEHVPNGVFDLIMLGMGDDGHTASLFPGTDALNEKKRLVAANFVPSKGVWRLTFTFVAINKAQQAIFYVLGQGKSKRVAEILSPKGNHFPAAHVGSREKKALWILDKESAEELIKEHPELRPTIYT